MRNKKQLSEIIFAACVCFAACLFGFLFTYGLLVSGAIVINIPHGGLLLAFIFLCVFALAFSLFYLNFQKQHKDVEKIAKAVEKIKNGDCEICLDDVSGQYKRIAETIEAVALVLKQSNEAKNDFINDFSHELKTPIVSIRGFAKLIAKGNLSEDEKNEYLSIIVSESERLIDLTASTLMLDRLTNNRLDINVEEFDLSETLRKCVLVLQSAWEKKNIDLETDVGDCRITGNSELLSRLFINVLDNAIKFTPENGKVSVSLTETAKEVAVTIADSGIGMDEETKRRMFDKYFRAEKSRTTHGNGLGLATVKKISELLDLKIDVESSLKKGTSFKIIIKKRR